MFDLQTLWHDQTGLTTVEYALLLALLVVAGVAVWTGLGQQTATSAGSSSDRMAESMG